MRALAALGEECDRLSSRMADLVDAEIHRLLFLGAGGRRAARWICLCPEGIPRGIATGVAMIGILCVVASLALAAGETNDVDAVIQLVKSGAAESLVVKTIQKGGKSYSLTPADVLRLRNAGVSNTIIEAMLEATPAPTASRPPSKAPAGKASSAKSSPGDREPTEAEMAAALKAGADAGNAQLKDIEEKCRSGAYRKGNDQALAMMCLAGAMGTGGAGGIRKDITGFRKVACSRASGRPGWNCDYAVREKVSGLNVGPTMSGMMNTPTVQHGRFVYLDNRWVLIE